MESLTVPAYLYSLKQIREFVMNAAKIAGLDQKTAYHLCLGVDEIATNAIEHGYANIECEKILHISADLSERTLKIILEDRGIPYDPHQTPKVDDFDLPLEKRRTGGLGVYLTQKKIDEFFYERAGDWNRVTFIVKMELHERT